MNFRDVSRMRPFRWSSTTRATFNVRPFWPRLNSLRRTFPSLAPSLGKAVLLFFAIKVRDRLARASAAIGLSQRCEL